MERIGREVERELGRGGSRDAIPLAAVTAAWPVAVGDAIARNAWPLRIARDGTLHVATASATWANELTFLADEILGRLRERVGPDAPAKVKCAAGPIPEAARLDEREPEHFPAAEDMPPEVRSAAASAASVITDPELREIVARAARASLLKARSGRDF
jgi:predicted nucleic acid-binding Zn ribbon protein